LKPPAPSKTEALRIAPRGGRSSGRQIKESKIWKNTATKVLFPYQKGDGFVAFFVWGTLEQRIVAVSTPAA
jgi:hypothetical protein